MEGRGHKGTEEDRLAERCYGGGGAGGGISESEVPCFELHPVFRNYAKFVWIQFVVERGGNDVLVVR